MYLTLCNLKLFCKKYSIYVYGLPSQLCPKSFTDSSSGSRYNKSESEETSRGSRHHKSEPEEDDDVTSKVVGGFGRWQLQISILMSLLKLSNAWYQLNIIFMAPAQEFWCAKPKIFDHMSEKEWRDICAPVSNLIYILHILCSTYVRNNAHCKQQPNLLAENRRVSLFNL